MQSAPIPDNERARLDLLSSLDILDTLEEQAYDDLTQLAASICDTPICLVSLVDQHRQWFKSHYGLDATETPRDMAFCAHAILEDKTLCIPDSEKDARFNDNPLVTGAPHVKFYAGVPLTLREHLRVGTLCVIDHQSKQLTAKQLTSLEALARQVVAQLELRLKLKEQTQLDRMKSEFLAMVSHELRTPLTSIYGNLALIHSGALTEDSTQEKTLIEKTLNSTSRLNRIVNDILELTKFESNQFEIEKSNNNLNQTVLTAVDSLSSYLETCEVSINLMLASDLPNNNYDNERIIQVLYNLISNSAKFSPAHTTINITTQQLDNELQVDIQDFGPGIPTEAQEHIFQKFSKLANDTKGKLPGTGLGLNIAHKLIQLHHGHIWFETKVGQGTTFSFSLPL